MFENNWKNAWNQSEKCLESIGKMLGKNWKDVQRQEKNDLIDCKDVRGQEENDLIDWHDVRGQEKNISPRYMCSYIST